MKHKITTLILILLISLKSVAQTSGLIDCLNSYSFDLFKEIKVTNDNVFLSPLCTYIALSIAYEGAASDTKHEFEKVLHISDPVLHKDFINYAKTLTNRLDLSNYLNVSNALWIQNSFTIDGSYLKTIRNQYSAEIKSVDFRNKYKAISDINQWISEKTENRIKEMIQTNDVDDLTRIIISSTIYFVTSWEDKFDKKLTKPDTFYSIDNISDHTDFMNIKESLEYFENDKFQFVSKDYQEYDKSFCIILPKERYGINFIESELNKDSFASILKNTKSLEVNLSIPKFTLETNYELVEPLKRLGLIKAFSTNADFSRITKTNTLNIDKVIHNAYIMIDEEKTEATASTVISHTLGYAGGISTDIKYFKADHPFIFMIIDNKTKGIIFIGRYVKPK